jgi:putative peptidoglycan lipid II flippase
MLVSTLGAGAFFLFSQVFSLIAFPISFIAVSISQASLPTLTKEANENIAIFRQTLLSTFHQILYLVVPITVLMVVLKLPITRVVFNFPVWNDTLVVAQVLLVFAPAIIAQSAIHLWVRGLYALQDTVSPLTAGAVGVVTSVMVSVLTLSTLGMRGVALGMVAGGFVTLFLLMYFMLRKVGGFSWSGVMAPVARILFAGAIMAIAVYLPVRPMEGVLFDTSRTADLVMLSVVVGGFGLSLYLFVTWILGSAEIVLFIKVAHKLRKWREAFVRFPLYEGAGISSELPGDS